MVQTERFCGKIYSNIPEHKSFTGLPSNRQQHYEMTKSELLTCISRLIGKPLNTEHDGVKIGHIVNAWIDAQNDCYVMFELDMDVAGGQDAAARIQCGVMDGLSLKHDRFTLDPIEVSVCFNGARPGTGVVGKMVSHVDPEFEHVKSTLSGLQAQSSEFTKEATCISTPVAASTYCTAFVCASNIMQVEQQQTPSGYHPSNASAPLAYKLTELGINPSMISGQQYQQQPHQQQQQQQQQQQLPPSFIPSQQQQQQPQQQQLQQQQQPQQQQQQQQQALPTPHQVPAQLLPSDKSGENMDEEGETDEKVNPLSTVGAATKFIESLSADPAITNEKKGEIMSVLAPLLAVVKQIQRKNRDLQKQVTQNNSMKETQVRNFLSMTLRDDQAVNEQMNMLKGHENTPPYMALVAASQRAQVDLTNDVLSKNEMMRRDVARAKKAAADFTKEYQSSLPGPNVLPSLASSLVNATQMPYGMSSTVAASARDPMSMAGFIPANQSSASYPSSSVVVKSEYELQTEQAMQNATELMRTLGGSIRDTHKVSQAEIFNRARY